MYLYLSPRLGIAAMGASLGSEGAFLAYEPRYSRPLGRPA